MKTNFTQEQNTMSLVNAETLMDAVIATIQNEFKKERDKDARRLYTINQVAKKLGKSHQTIKKYVMSGIIASTANGLISDESVQNFIYATQKSR
jgi:hypothetical protein